MSQEWADVALPWGADVKSFIEPKDDNDVLKTSIIFILLTRLGERLMRPDFGSEIPDSVFEQNDEVLTAILSTSVQEAINKWDDRVEFMDFEAEIDENVLHIKVSWKNSRDPLSDTVQVTEFELSPSSLGG